MEGECGNNISIQAKIVILGEQNVGKTSFVVVYSSGGQKRLSVPGAISSTIGASFVTCRVPIEGGKAVRMQIMDTAGQERFRSMAPLYYRKANGAVIMYDLSSYQSFQAAKLWVMELKRNVEAPVLILLVGNKADLADRRAVPYEEGYSYAQSVGAVFHETSAATSQGVSEAFTELARNLIKYEEEHSNFEYKLNSSDIKLSESSESDNGQSALSRSLCCSI